MNMIEISSSMARYLLPCMELRLAKLKLELSEGCRECCELQFSIAELKARLCVVDAFLGKNRKRLRKGVSGQVVSQLLSNLPEGESLSVAEIVKRTGVKQSTIYRVLMEPKHNKGRFIQEGNEWRIK